MASASSGDFDDGARVRSADVSGLSEASGEAPGEEPGQAGGDEHPRQWRGSGYLTGIVGDPGSGKSVFGRSLLAEHAKPGGIAVYHSANPPETDPLEYGEEYTVEALTTKFHVGALFDEVHEELYQGVSPRSPLGRFLHRGRHAGAHVILVTQWPAKVDKSVFRVCRHIYFFHLEAFEDLEWIARRWGETAARQVANLPFYQSIHVEKGQPLPEGWAVWRENSRISRSLPTESET